MNTKVNEASITKRRQIFKRFWIFVAGIFCNFAGYGVLLALQSSINIEDGVGAKSITASYVTAAIFGVVFTPVLLRKLGPKASVLISEVTYFLYILANYYPVSYILIPASILVGIGEATMWPAMILFCVHYAHCYSKQTNPAMYVTRFLGYFYFSFYGSQVFGNLISYGILYGGKTPLNNTLNLNQTIDFSVCGSHDCQDPNIVSGQLYKYYPTSAITLYISIGVMAGLVLTAFLIHFCFIPDFNTTSETNEEDLNVQENHINDANTEETKIKEENIELDNKNIKNGRTNTKLLTNNAQLQENKGLMDDSTMAKSDSTKQDNQSVFSIIKATIKHIISPKTLLISPFPIYSGLLMAFGFAELTRAFGSCLIGVSQVGILMAISCSFNALSPFLACKFASTHGRNIPFFVAFCLDITNYMTCLFWTPTNSTLWVVYILFALGGSSNGIWQSLVNELHTSYFPNKEDIALSVWNFYALIGIAIQSTWSVYLCVNVKIYIQIGFLCFSLLCYITAERIYYGKK